MIICSCRAVGDQQVREAIELGARNIDDVAQTCGAGGRCRGCWPSLQRMIDEAAHHDCPARGALSNA